ncbi:MAG: hypothetical protein JXA69_08185, partial [Phycisphaerae bacterium]|nr:hypothetical protein [Phycisphaerae bacterium]
MKANPFESQLERLARTLTEQFGVQVVCQGDNAWTDGRQIVLPTLPGPLTRRAGDARSPALDAPRPPTADSERACSATAGQGPEGTRHASGPASQGEPSTEDLERLVIGYLDHEMAHVAFSDFQVAAEFSRKHRGFEGILNVVEDALIERLAMQRWPGVRRNLDRMFEQIRPRVRRLIQQRSPFDRFCTAVYLRLSHHQDIMGLDAELAGFGDLLAQFPQIGTTQQAADLAEQILRRWQQQAPGPRHQPQPSPDTQPDAQAETTPESGSPTPAEQGSQGSDAGQASSGASEGANDDSAAPGGDPSGDSAEPGAANAESRQRSGTRG